MIPSDGSKSLRDGEVCHVRIRNSYDISQRLAKERLEDQSMQKTQQSEESPSEKTLLSWMKAPDSRLGSGSRDIYRVRLHH